nr:PREDICTED: high affinity immunoglobulin alpha and immunoglobulin mu Fc receptor [Apteryx mantelli mantelli]
MVVFLLLVALLPDPISSVLYGSRFLTGEVGGSVTHQCFYAITPANIYDRKYWCKIAESRACYTVISTSGYTARGYEGRVSLQDVPQNGTFTVTMTQLKTSDAGAYRCGVGISNAGLFVRQQLVVLEVGGSLSLQCRYDPRRSYEKKYVCRWEAGRCSPLADADGFVHGSYAGRMQIAGDDRENGTFTVVMSNLREDDAGWYWCGAKSRHVEQTSPVKLRIQGETWSSRGPETSTAVDPTSSSTPAAYSTTTQRSVTGQTYTEGGDVHGESTSALVSVLRSTTFETSRREIYRGRMETGY